MFEFEQPIPAGEFVVGGDVEQVRIFAMPSGGAGSRIACRR
jgi:hypothetical protein